MVKAKAWELEMQALCMDSLWSSQFDLARVALGLSVNTTLSCAVRILKCYRVVLSGLTFEVSEALGGLGKELLETCRVLRCLVLQLVGHRHLSCARMCQDCLPHSQQLSVASGVLAACASLFSVLLPGRRGGHCPASVRLLGAKFFCSSLSFVLFAALHRMLEKHVRERK